LLDLGCNQILNPVAEAVLENAAQLEIRLASVGAKVHRARSSPQLDHELSGILTFDVPGVDPNAVRQRLAQGEIAVSVRHGRVRVAAHAYNNEQDISRLVDVVQDIITHS
jgi:selenocysteine lyase/cysteine desulfurase